MAAAGGASGVAAADAEAATPAGQGRFDFSSDGHLTAASKIADGTWQGGIWPVAAGLDETAAQLEHVLGDFSVKGEITEAYGPVVTRYDLVLAQEPNRSVSSHLLMTLPVR